MHTPKSKKEKELFDIYFKWIQADYVPPHIIENFKKEIKWIKKS